MIHFLITVPGVWLVQERWGQGLLVHSSSFYSLNEEVSEWYPSVKCEFRSLKVATKSK